MSLPPTFKPGDSLKASDLNTIARRAFARLQGGGVSLSSSAGSILLSILDGKAEARRGRVVAVVGPNIGTQSQISYDCEIFGLPSTRAVRVPALGRHFDDDNLPLIRASQPEDPCIFVDLPDGEGGVERLLWIINERIITTQCQGTP